MRPDPKFGWHTLWITPLLGAILLTEIAKKKIKNLKARIFRSRTKHLDPLRRQAGIK